MIDTRKLLRFATVTALAIWSLGHTLPDTARFWHPLGTFGYRSNIYGKIVSVRDGSPVAAAGLKPGDKVDLLREPPEYRSKIEHVLSAGVVVPLAFLHAGQRHVVLLKAEPQQLSGSQKLVLVARLFAAVFLRSSAVCLSSLATLFSAYAARCARKNAIGSDNSDVRHQNKYLDSGRS